MADKKINEVYIRGRISHLYGNDRFGSITVPYAAIVGRRNRENGQNRMESTVESYFPEARFDSNTKTKNIINTFHEGDHVLIKGHLEAFSTQVGAGFEERTIIYIDEIQHDSTRMEQFLGVSGLGGQYPDAMHEIHLEAKVIGITKRHTSIYEYRLECEFGSRTYAVTGTQYRAPSNMESRIHMGDIVYIIGAIETSRNEYRGKAYFNSNFVVQEIVTQKEFTAKYNEAAAKQEAAGAAAPEEETVPADAQ